MGLLLLSTPSPILASGPVGTLLALEVDAGARHVRSFRTQVMTTWSGLETRVSRWLRARETIEATVVLDTEQDMRVLRRLRTFNPIDAYYVAIRWESAIFVSDVVGSTFTVDASLADWLSPGQSVIVEAPGATGYTGVVQSTSGSGAATIVTLDAAATGGSYRAGVAQVAPLRPFYLDDQSPLGRYQVNVGRWTVHMHSVVPDAAPVAGAPATLVTYNGLVLVDRRPISAGYDTEDRPQADVNVIDMAGTLLPEKSHAIANIYRSHHFHVGGYADRQYWRLLHATLRGAQVACYLPTWRNDLPVTLVAGATLTVADAGEYVTYWYTRVLSRHVQIVFASGTVARYGVASATLVGGNSQVVLDTDISALGAVSVVSIVELVHLATDDLAFTIGAGGNAALTLGFVAVQQ